MPRFQIRWNTGAGVAYLRSGGDPPGQSFAIRAVTADPAHITISWVDGSPGSSPISAYRITPYQGTTAQNFSDYLVGVTTLNNGVRSVVASVPENVLQSYTIAAINGSGVGIESAQTNPVMAASDPLAFAFGAGGSYWTRYNQAALLVGRDLVPQQRRIFSDPTLLGSGSADPLFFPNKWYPLVAATHIPRGWSPPPSLPLTIIPSVPGIPLIGAASTVSTAANQVSWVDQSQGSQPITGYVVTPYIGATAQPTTFFAVGATTLNGNIRSVQVAATGGVVYTYTVRAVNSVGQSAESFHSNTVTTLSVSAPSAPTITNVFPGSTSASVTFTPPSNNGGAAIDLYRFTVYLNGILSTSVTGSGSPIVVTGLTNGAGYTATVAAHNSQGFGAESAPSAVFTPQAPFAARINVGGAAATDTNNIAWAVDSGAADGTTFDAGSSLVLVTPTPTIDRFERFGVTNYSIPVPYAGTFVVRLHLGPETNPGFNAAGDRVFDVLLNGTVVLPSLDLFATVGQDVTYLYVGKVTVTSPLSVSVGFVDHVDHSLVSGIEVYSDTLGPVIQYPPAITTGTPGAPPSTVLSDPGTWSGTPAPTFTYQWQRVVGTIASNIVGATSSSYTTSTADNGNKVQVVVTATNSSGTASVTSLPTGTIGNTTTVTGGARITAGLHVDQNVYEAAPYSKASTAEAWVRGAAVLGFSTGSQVVGSKAGPPTSGMIEATPSLTTLVPYGSTKQNWDPMATDLVMNFNDSNFGPGPNQWLLPAWCFSLYGALDGFTPAQIAAGAVDQQMIDLCPSINAIPWPLVTIRPAWECDIGTTNYPSLGNVGLYNPVDIGLAMKRYHDVMTPHITRPVLWEFNAWGYPGAVMNDALIGNRNVQGSAFQQTGGPSGTLNAAGYNLAQYFPVGGDSIFDIFASDFYCQPSNPSDTYALGGPIQCQKDAVRHGKLFAATEWGILDGVNGAPLTQESSGRAAAFMRATISFFDSIPYWNRVGSWVPGALLMHDYFQGNPGGASFLLEVVSPTALGIFQQRMRQP